jgi:hypothetical protein
MRAIVSNCDPFTLGPRFTGGPQGSERLVRLVIQISPLPYPPGRADVLE